MTFYIRNIHIQNIRCFTDLKIPLNQNCDLSSWCTVLGENATGKTTLLRSIAIGLCDRSSAAGLLRESEEGYISRGADQGEILLELGTDDSSLESISIKTTIKKIRNGTKESFEDVTEQTITPSDAKPWFDIFVCAYGVGRGTSGSGDLSGYSIINGVYNLFNYSEGLQNPELAFRRSKDDWKLIRRKLLVLLPESKDVRLEEDGIYVDGPWGEKMPLRDLADGYRSTCLWMTDLLGWALMKGQISKGEIEPVGILLIDAIEEHLHPRWQRTVVADIRKVFPKIQVICTTHSPIVVANAGKMRPDDVNSMLFHLYFEEGRVHGRQIEEGLGEMNYDQILGSSAFDHVYSINNTLMDLLEEASKLADKKERDKKEDAKLRSIKGFLKNKMFPRGRTLIERIVEREFYDELKKEESRLKDLLDE